MANTPWMNVDDLVTSIQRKISIPLSQNSFSESDILQMANEEMAVSQVPSILEYHEEYFVTYTTFPLIANQQNYPIPNRAIGGKIRNVFFVDTNDNLSEMTRVSPDDKAFFQRTDVSSPIVMKFYFEGNDIVIVPKLTAPTGSIRVDYFLRPNLLVPTANAATSTSFTQTVTLTNSSIVAGDTVTIAFPSSTQLFTAVSSSPGTNQFLLDVSSAATAANLAAAINTNGILTASAINGVVTLTSVTNVPQVTTSNTSGFTIPTTLSVNFTSVPTTFTSGMLVDFLQTQGGHRTLGMDVAIPTNGISGNTINFTTSTVPVNMIVGDYICPQYQCIIPQIPDDLHSGLAERTASRILASIGDLAGLQESTAKIQDIKNSESKLLANRAEGNPMKVSGRRGILFYNKFGNYRRLR